MTTKRTIYVTAADMTRLRSLVTNQKNGREDLKILNAELDRAQVVAPAEIPRDVITMNSKARLRRDENHVRGRIKLDRPGRIDDPWLAQPDQTADSRAGKMERNFGQNEQPS